MRVASSEGACCTLFRVFRGLIPKWNPVLNRNETHPNDFGISSSFYTTRLALHRKLNRHPPAELMEERILSLFVQKQVRV